MAEARGAIQVYEQKRGIQLAAHEEGITLTITIPHPSRLRSSVIRRVHRFGRWYQDMIYPIPTWGLLLIAAVVVWRVVTSDKESWWRSGWLAHFLWNIDSFIVYLPFVFELPTRWRMGYLAFIASAIILCFIMASHHALLRFLLSYKGFLYRSPGKKTNYVLLIWGGCVKALMGTRPSTFSLQRILPCLAVPSLKATCLNYLKSMRPLLDDKAYEELEKQATKFRLDYTIRKLHYLLVLKSWIRSNYVTDWWEKYVYLRARSPLMINSNYYVMDSHSAPPTCKQAARAAGVVHIALHFKWRLDRELIQPMLLSGVVPLCMAQYERLFSTTRIPGRELDKLTHYAPGARGLGMAGDFKHIVVLRRGYFFRLKVELEGGRIPSVTSLVASKLPSRRSSLRSTPYRPPPKQNKRSLQVIERAIMVMVLRDESPTSWNDRGRELLHGDGRSSWFDKSLTCHVFANGHAGLNSEHSWADALVTAHLWETVLTGEPLHDYYDKDGNCSASLAPAKTSCLVVSGKVNEAEAGTASSASKMVLSANRLAWDLEPETQAQCLAAFEAAKKMCEDLQLDVCAFREYGKGVVKKCRISPDAWLQMALQLAYYRQNQKFELTYEAAMVRLFNKGRTETVRPCTPAARAFVLAMCARVKGKASAGDVVALLRDAATTHQNLNRDAMCGKGVDRHLFCLFVLAMGFGVDSTFLKAALSRPWRLSTSQQPQQQDASRWKELKEKFGSSEQYFSPGGGFGPVADDGYGVSYMIAGEDAFFFHISSKGSSSATDSDAFKKHLFEALNDMRTLFVDLESEGAKKTK